MLSNNPNIDSKSHENFKNKHRLLIVLGNFIEHFDAALYGFCAPLIASQFFPEYSYLSQLILSYGLFSISLISRPIGAYYFSKRAETAGLHRLLSITLIGIGFATFIFGLAPTYAFAGICAPLYLCICRLLQGFFAGGETSLAPLALIESRPQRSSFYMSFYGLSTILGIMAASFSIQLLYYWPTILSLWRWLFIIGGVLAIICGILRSYLYPATEKRAQVRFTPLNFKLATHIFIVTGLSYHFYSFPFVFMPNLMTLISAHTYQTFSAWSTVLMIMDAFAGLLIGYYIDRFKRKDCLIACLTFYIINIPVIICLIQSNDLVNYLIAILIIIIIGVTYNLVAIPYLRLDLKVGYTQLDVINAISAEALGKTTPVICLTLWKIYPALFMPFCYGIILCALSIYLSKVNKHLQNH